MLTCEAADHEVGEVACHQERDGHGGEPRPPVRHQCHYDPHGDEQGENSREAAQCKRGDGL